MVHWTRDSLDSFSPFLLRIRDSARSKGESVATDTRKSRNDGTRSVEMNLFGGGREGGDEEFFYSREIEQNVKFNAFVIIVI